MMRNTARTIAAVVLAGLMGLAAAADDAKPQPVKLTKIFDYGQGQAAVLSPDGKRLALSHQERIQKKTANSVMGGTASRVKLLEIADGKETAAITGAFGARFAGNGKTLMVQQRFDEQFFKAGQPFSMLSFLSMPQLWDITNPQKPRQLFVIDGAMQERFSPHSKLVAIAGGPEQKFGNSGKVITGLPRGNSKAIGNMNVGGMGLFGGMSLKFIEVWDADSAKLVARFGPDAKSKGGASNPAFSPDGQIVAASTQRNDAEKIVLYDIAAKKEVRLIDLGKGHLQWHYIPAVQLTRLMQESCDLLQFCGVNRASAEDEPYLLGAVVGTKESSALKLWKPSTGEVLATVVEAKNEDGMQTQIDFCFAADGKTLAASVLKVKTNAVPAGGAGAGAVGGVPGAGAGLGVLGGAGAGNNQFGNLGGQFGLLGGAGKPNPGGKAPAPPPVAVGRDAVAIARPFGAGPEPVAGEVILWDMEKRTTKHTLKVIAPLIRFGGDGMLATVCVDDNASKLKLWDVASGQEVGRLDDCHAVQFSTDGSTMLTRSGEPTAPVFKVWTVEKPKP
jgi:WD40 repeat protein